MKIKAIRILAGLMAAALPTLAHAQASSPSGATLGSFTEAASDVDSENLRLHTVQRKEHSDGGRSEVVLYPVVAQINTKFTRHMGLGAQYLYHLHENFALQALGQFFYVNEQTKFTEELVSGSQQAPQAATALTLQWAATGGFEVTPIYGKFAFYEGNMAHFGLVLSGGAGVGGTRIQIAGDTFGDTGMKFVGQVGAGFRVRLGENFLVRLEVKDLIYTAKVDSINGCNLEDLTNLSAKKGAASGGCQAGKFGGGSKGETNVHLSKGLVEDASSDVLNNISVYGGVSYSF